MRVRRLLGQPHNELGYRNATSWLAGLVTSVILMAASSSPLQATTTWRGQTMKLMLLESRGARSSAIRANAS